MPLGKTLAALRKSAGMTQGELGEKLNISAQAISKWENGTSEPDIATLRKIADIYGIPVAKIIDPDSECTENKESGDGTAEEKASTGFDATLTSINPERKITAIAYLRNLLGIDLVSAKNAVENLPYVITGGATEEEFEKISAYFGEIGATVSAAPASGTEERRKLNFEKPKTDEKPKKKNIFSAIIDLPFLVKRIIVATLTALIPSIAWLVIILPGETATDMILLASYIGLALFATVFQLWYPTLVRKLLGWGGDIWSEVDGLFSFLFAIILSLVYLVFLVVMIIVSPVFLIFSLPVRIKRIICYDIIEDDIFF